ncbi:MAG: DUF333 domain-containing protein [Patescibacteria group bacterium]|nr:DUF333 domain-containing protein [Patescibacteria group bacterium]
MNYKIIKDIFSPICNEINSIQGKNYTPAWCGHLNDTTPTVAPKLNTNLNLQIANPASDECVVAGAKIEMYTNDSGQFGICVFSDKSICDEWALFRKECKQGQCLKVCKYIGTTKEGWYNSCDSQLLQLIKCSKNTTSVPENSGAIIVNSPKADEQLSSPFTVSGTAKISSDKVFIRVKNTSNKVLISEQASLSELGTDGYGSFFRKINYEFSTTKEGFVEIYDLSASGVEENMVSIPVKF